MTFIRAAEKINLGVMRKCAVAYPKLATICNPADCNLRVRPEFKLVKDHAVELSREAVTRELTSLQGNGDQMDAQVKTRKKSFWRNSRDLSQAAQGASMRWQTAGGISLRIRRRLLIF